MRLALTVGLSALGIIGFVLLPAAAPVEGQVTNIVMGDDWFCEPSFENGVCETTVNAGTTVVWQYTSGDTAHTVTECGDSLEVCDPPVRLWHSGSLIAGWTFSQLFDTPGVYLYRCQIHTDQMRGRLVVQEAPPAPAPTSTTAPTISPSPAASATPPAPTESASPASVSGAADGPSGAATESVRALPVGGGSPPDSGGGSSQRLTVAGALTLLMAGTATALVRLRRR